MATMTTPLGEPISVGRILGRTFAAIAANPLVFLGVAFVFGALPSLILSYFGQEYRAELATQPNGLRDGTFLTIGSGIIGLVLASIVQGALVRATVAYAEGRRASIGESVAAGMRVVLPLIGLSIVVAVCVFFGFALLLVPGIILYLMWSVAAPALVEEQVGIFGALGRSRRLSKGARWKIFGLELVIVIIVLIVSATLGYLSLSLQGGFAALARASRTGLPLALLIGNAIVSTLLNAVWSSAQTSLYVDLRDWKDGPQTAHLGDVFA